MADPVVPYFINDIGSENIRIGVTRFKCMGARPPLDHPHVFLDMTTSGQVICPYCSSLYIHDDNLDASRSDPDGCLYENAVSAE